MSELLETKTPPMMVLVLGATGFVGRNLVRESLKHGYRVRCFVRNPLLARRLFSRSIEIISGNVLDLDSLRKACKGVGAVIDSVGVTYEAEGVSFKRVHVQGIQNILRAMKENNVKRLVHMSVFGADKKSSAGFYRSKGEAEELIRQSGMEYTIFRPAVMFGPGDKLLRTYVEIIHWSPVVPMAGSGKSRMQPVFVQDVCRAAIEALKNPVMLNREYDLGGPDILSSVEIMNMLFSAYGTKRLKIHVPYSLLWFAALLMEKLLPTPLFSRQQLSIMKKNIVCDCSAAKKDFGFSPMSFQKNVRSYIDMVMM